MNNNYWSKIVNKRTSRRRALAGAGGFAVGAAFLAACGGDDDGPSSSGGTGSRDRSGLLVETSDSTGSAKAGGTWPHYVTEEVRTMDPLNNASAGTGINNQAFAYSRLFQWKPGIKENPVGGEFVPDAAESFEQSPDGLTLTFKLNPNVKFDPRPPTTDAT